MSNELYHVGVGHLHGGHSGRYPWGSGNRKSIKEQYTKEQALRSGKATIVNAYRYELTDAELSNAIKRIENDRKLSQLMNDEKTSTKIVRKFNNTIKSINSATKTVDDLYKTYEQLDSIYVKINKRMAKKNESK